MPDSRASHITYPPGPSLINQKPPSAANAIYGSRGPQRAAPDYGARKPNSGPPESIEHHIEDCIARVPDLSARQRNGLKAELMRLVKNIDFIALVASQHRGPHSAAAAGLPQDEGRPI